MLTPYLPGPGPDLSFDPQPTPIRRTVVLILLTGFSLLMLLGGVGLLLSGDHALGTLIAGSVLAVLGLPLPLWSAAWLARHLRGFIWAQKSRCERCGYAVDGLLVATCPECGGSIY